jgi:hypothetical protein
MASEAAVKFAKDVLEAIGKVNVSFSKAKRVLEGAVHDLPDGRYGVHS